MAAAMAARGSAERVVASVVLEPALSDAEVCCRFEDVANEGHQLMQAEDYAGARKVYQSLQTLLQSLSAPSAIMQVRGARDSAHLRVHSPRAASWSHHRACSLHGALSRPPQATSHYLIALASNELLKQHAARSRPSPSKRRASGPKHGDVGTPGKGNGAAATPGSGEAEPLVVDPEALRKEMSIQYSLAVRLLDGVAFASPMDEVAAELLKQFQQSDMAVRQSDRALLSALQLQGKAKGTS